MIVGMIEEEVIEEVVIGMAVEVLIDTSPQGIEEALKGVRVVLSILID